MAKTVKIIVWIIVIVIVVWGIWYLLSSTSTQTVVNPSADTGLNGSPNKTNTGQ